MTEMVKASLAALAAFVVLDGVWLGVVMKDFYRTQLAPIARISNGGLAPLWSVAWMIYVLLGVGVGVFVVPRATSPGQATILGAVLGAVVYGVYDLTNYSTLTAWPLAVTLADIAWGVSATALVSAAVYGVLAR